MSQEGVDTSRWIRTLTQGELPVMLIAAVVQGGCLYALHRSVDGGVWPATDPGWLTALYSVAVLVPLTLQRLAQHVRQPLLWMIIAVLAGAYLMIGWHYGAWALRDPVRALPEDLLGLALILGLHWLLVMPFLQARLIEGRWRSRYELLFGSAWNNHLVLAEAVLFTGLFWLLLALSAALFETLGIKLVGKLFQEPLFNYPVTSIVFAVALSLIGSLERLTNVLLEQTLNVLKWLALLVGSILGLFTFALLLQLPGMIASGQKAIAATWLLWLIAVTVLLVNAAYRDGSVERPYPRVVGNALRCVIPLTLIIALMAIYALILRIDQYGFTVGRFWACVVAGAALLYSAGYTLAVRDKSHWMRSIARVNVVVALYLIAVMTLALTPILSPQRIAANSQYVLAQASPEGAVEDEYSTRHLSYLRYDAGKYGRRRLEELTRIVNHPRAEAIRQQALALLKEEPPAASGYDTSKLLERLVLQPSGRTLDPRLIELLKEEVFGDPEKLAGVFIDLNGDTTEEFVLLYDTYATVFGYDGSVWSRIAAMEPEGYTSSNLVIPLVTEGNFKAAPSRWSDLVVGDVRYRLQR